MLALINNANNNNFATSWHQVIRQPKLVIGHLMESRGIREHSNCGERI